MKVFLFILLDMNAVEKTNHNLSQNLMNQAPCAIFSLFRNIHYSRTLDSRSEDCYWEKGRDTLLMS